MRRHLIWIFPVVAMWGLSAPAYPAATPLQTSGVAAAPAGQTGTKTPPKKKTAINRPIKVKFGPLQTGPQVQNPAAASAQMTINTSLQQQRQAADAEAGQMKLGIRSQAKPGTPPTANKANATQPTTLLKSSSGSSGMLGPEKTMDSQGLASRAATQTQFSDTVLVCAHDPTMRILTVSGKAQPATFTSDDRFNFYTIAGCSFGNPGPSAKVWIYYQNTFHEQFQIQQWNDNGIQLNLPANLTGLLDQNNLTLVVQRADEQEATKTGFKFYAARETKRLASFPKSQFSLNTFTLNKTSDLQSQYVSPSSSASLPVVGEPGIPGYMAEVFWICTDCFARKSRFDNVYMQGNEDVWQFKTLQPGFVLQNAGFAYRPIQCDGSQVQTEGSFGLQIVGSEVHMQWQGQTCVQDCGGGGLFSTDCFFEDGSDYVLWAFVTGPRGVDPWTGKPTS